MEANNLPSLNWSDGPWAAWGTIPGAPGAGDGCGDGTGTGCGDETAVGAGRDLMAFLTDFRTAQNDEAEAARLSAMTRRGSSGAAGSRARRPEADGERAATLEDPFQGSEVPMAPDWWLATDGRWYRPELHPDAQQPTTTGQAATTGQVATADQTTTTRPAAATAQGILTGDQPAAGEVERPSVVTAPAEAASARVVTPGERPGVTAASEDRRRGRRRLLPGRPGRGLRPAAGPACA